MKNESIEQIYHQWTREYLLIVLYSVSIIHLSIFAYLRIFAKNENVNPYKYTLSPF